jgi:glycine oxidase
MGCERGRATRRPFSCNERAVRVVIIGAGVMGCGAALELSRLGVRDIVVLERAVAGAEASSAAAGMLAAQVEAGSPDELATYVRARDGYAGWAAELRERTGVDIAHRRSGALDVATTEAELPKLAELVASSRAAGLRAELLDSRAALDIERELSPSLAGAAWFPEEASVDPPQLLRALVAAIDHAGVRIESGVSVARILERAGRCVGVATEGHGTFEADAVILAAGSWSSLVPGIPAFVPKVRPIRGQLVMLEERPPRLRTIVFQDKSYAVPRGDGRVVCGSTMEDVGHRREVTAAGVSAILSSAIAMVPRLGVAELSRVWCNFRPRVEEGPQVGASALPGLFLATGHHRNGILLAKVTAETVARAVLDQAAPT